ncbi:hypothetical protein Rleg4DRAFT_1444 [Rhizobium leguminosarum bv. trifolii WSM2297]|uniref:Uncharacterized protein n=1 Tax=Rhizobium leguminosarum bv. trifolii WSM2297 TaxID=754762 RepID=J0C9V1_RHILT|nr:hypothetical protein Rleg4DRAFT_1444 [Rhizobium leguminosarum bv. trifolii WSM2297]
MGGGGRGPSHEQKQQATARVYASTWRNLFVDIRLDDPGEIA